MELPKTYEDTREYLAIMRSAAALCITDTFEWVARKVDEALVDFGTEDEC